MTLVSRRVCGLALVALGAVLVVAHLMTTGSEPPMAFAVIVLAVGIAVIGVFVARGDLVSAWCTDRVLAWTALSAVSMPTAVLWVTVDAPVLASLFSTAVADAATVGAFAGVVVGLYDARNRKRQRDLNRLNRIANALRVATQEVVQADDRDDLEQSVCDRLATSAPYESVWVGRYDREDNTVRASAWAGLPDDYYESITITVDETPKGRGAGGRAIKTRETQAIPDVFEDETMEPWWDTLEEHGIRSLAVVPIHHEDTVYGFYSIYADRPEVFDTAEREVLTELGETLGNAISAIETREQLAAREQELARQNRRLAEFASIVSHDLRNPLNVAEGYVDLARETADGDTEDSLNRADAALDRMRELIEDVLALARQGETVNDPAPVALDSVVADAWAAVDTDGATLETRDLERILADRSRFQQLLENLFRNAMEHGADENGRVTVTVGALTDGFYVADDGPGIPEQARERVFETGYSSSDTGTGLGLNIARSIAEAHGWEVELTESASGGARFEFRSVETAE
ncbi:ATP-binding protein [Salarchaeum sp. III]|uniref:receiver/sensor box histidine kinase n=1 Tax=Salarchaeum sp. III TaxID=3107927 RepID=UPI002ED7E1E5